MTGWHRPDVVASARDHLAQVVGPVSAQQMIDGLIAKARADRDAEIIAWLGRKSGELRGLPKYRQESAPDALLTMADKIRRGAVRGGAA